MYVPSHVYFRVLNQANEKRHFLANADYEPRFRYGHRLKVSALRHQLAVLPDVDERQKETLELALAGARLQTRRTADAVSAFRDHNSHLFGEPRREYVETILARAHRYVTPDTKVLWDEVCAALGNTFEDTQMLGPSDEIFLQYREYLIKYAGDTLLKEKASSPLTTLRRLVKKSGLDGAGWTVQGLDDASHARVNQRKKIVYVGRRYVTRHPGASLRIAVHEIYGHALRGTQPSIAESEGFAIILEQLLDERFIMRRSYRYLAAALGWGVLGTPMTFREVFEILWRVMAIVSRYEIDKARHYAFDECARVFRGGRAEIAGAVYLKDSIYFSANIMMWEKLAAHNLRYNEFVDVIEGRRRVLV